MARRRRPEKREILPDPKFGDVILSKFMNSVMLDGKKSTAEAIVYTALETVETRAKREPIGVFHDALNNIRPNIEVRSRRVGGADVPGARRGPPGAFAGAGDPLADLRGARPQREYDVRAAGGRADGCGQQPRQCGEEARGRAPHGRSEPRLLALSLVVAYIALAKDRDGDGDATERRAG